MRHAPMPQVWPTSPPPTFDRLRLAPNWRPGKTGRPRRRGFLSAEREAVRTKTTGSRRERIATLGVRHQRAHRRFIAAQTQRALVALGYPFGPATTLAARNL